jgi:predicted PurR-regulated permease PerM
VPEPIPRLSVTSGSIARAVLLIAGWLVVMTVFARARGPLVLFVFGAVTAAVFYPAVGWLGKRMPTWVAIVLVSLLAAAVAGAVGARIYDEVNRQARDLANAVDEAVTTLEQSPRYGETVDRLDLRERADEFTSTVLDDVSFDGSRLTEIAPSLASGAGDVFVIWLFAVMLLAAGPQFVRSFVALFPSDVTKRRVQHVLRVAHHRSARFVGFMALRAFVYFLLTLLVGEVLDLRVPTILAVTMAVVSFVPRFGLMIGAMPFAVVAALRSPDLVLPVMLLAIVIQAVDAVYVQIPLERRSVPVGSLALLVFAIIGWSLEGTWGLILGVAGSAFVAAAIDESLAIRDGEVADPGPLDLGFLPPLTPPTSSGGAPRAEPGDPGLQPVPPLP